MCAMTQGTSSQQTNKNDKSEQIIVKLLSDNMESEGTIHVTEAWPRQFYKSMWG